MGNNNFLNNNEKAILVHFSSVGEFNLSKELIEKILQASKGEKNQKVILSVMTDTGFSAVSKIYSEDKNV